jgi:serine/threonine protein kinase
MLLGEGSWGSVYQGTYLGTSDEHNMKLKKGAEIAIKHETKGDKLEHEAKIYEILQRQALKGIPSMYHYGSEGGSNIMIMDRLGNSLKREHMLCSRHFTASTVGMIAYQMIERIEHMHERGILHRDIRPENFVMGQEGSNAGVVHVIDFGLSKMYATESGKRIISEGASGMVGTAPYVSINAHSIEQSPRDDLESIGYVLIYLLKGSLPWQYMPAFNKLTKDAMKVRKEQVTVEELCRDTPTAVLEYMRYVRSLSFNETPDYLHLRKLMTSIFTSVDVSSSSNSFNEGLLLAKLKSYDYGILI